MVVAGYGLRSGGGVSGAILVGLRGGEWNQGDDVLAFWAHSDK